ncbi:hypothetical protein [Streptomyces sp. NPDC051561]|uniref:hypothetical protein n=1 Tax=Streptomyces sp. NPDC051561 TaxID=3365658 RepID=UPI0037B76814
MSTLPRSSKYRQPSRRRTIGLATVSVLVLALVGGLAACGGGAPSRLRHRM